MIDSDEGKMVILLLLLFFIKRIRYRSLRSESNYLCVYIYRNCRVGLVNLFIFFFLKERKILKFK